MPYYKASGKAPVSGIAISLFAGIAAAFALSFLYVLVVHYIPFIYVNFFATIGYGLGVAIAIYLANRFGKIRSPGIVCLVALLVGLAACWFQWVYYLSWRYSGADQSVTDIYTQLIAHPDTLFQLMSTLSEHGAWRLGRASSDPVSGIPLILVWVVEAVIIVGIPVFVGGGSALSPFSERLGRWADDEKLPLPAPFVNDVGAAKAAFESGNFFALLDAAPVVAESQSESQSESQFSELTLYAVDGDPDCCYLSITNVTIKLDKKGKEERETSNIIKYLHISLAVWNKFRAKYGTAAQTAENGMV